MGSNSDLKAIGKRIAEQRQKNNLTQAELGNLLCVSREIINYWENGSRDIKTGNVVLLAEALNTTCDYILRGIDLKNADISKQTGLSNDAINNLREIALFTSESNPLFPALDAFLTNEDLEGFLIYFYQYQADTMCLRDSVIELYQTLQNNGKKVPKDFLKFANRIQDEENPYFVEANRVVSFNESLDYDLFKMQNVINSMASDYKEKILQEVNNVTNTET